MATVTSKNYNGIQITPVAQTTFTTGNIIPDLIITVPDTSDRSAIILSSNKGYNSNQNSPSLSTLSSADYIDLGSHSASTNNTLLRFESYGNLVTGGYFNNYKGTQMPNVFLNIKSYDYSTGNLVFRLKTDSLTSADVGNYYSGWSGDAYITTGVNLTGSSSNTLQVVSGYNNYFYELRSNDSIKNTGVYLPVTDNPCYTVFVFGIGKTFGTSNDSQNFYNVFTGCNIIHKFVQTYSETYPYFNSEMNVFNIGKENTFTTGDPNFTKFFTSFTASTYNTPKYLLQKYKNKLKYNNPQSTFWSDFNSFNQSSTSTYNDDQSFNGASIFNLSSSKTELSNNTINEPFALSTNGVSTVDLNLFSLFFVEMFSYTLKNSTNSDFNILKFETYINGKNTFIGSQYVDKQASIDSAYNYTIELSNKNVSSVSGDSRMFLFDYLQGTGSSYQDIRNQSETIVNSLAYKYKNLLLKSTSDMQIANSNSSLYMQPKLGHDFINIYCNGLNV